MKDKRQVNIMLAALNKKKSQFMTELVRINSLILNKEMLIAKMQSYCQEYERVNNFKLSKSIPNLHNNITLFIKKMSEIIEQTKIEITQLRNRMASIYENLSRIEREIDLMNRFAKRIQQEETKRQEKSSQLLIDDLAAISKIKETE